MARIDETAFAKINIDLRICGRRADGYHDLDSLVAFAEAGDRLFFEPADELILAIDGPFGDALSDDDGNLVVRAAKALAEMAGREAHVRISLDKVLPIASGLGGGSADAAAALRGLTKLWKLPFGLTDLVPLARGLGADVPICLGSTTARMEGIGDRLTPLSIPMLPCPLILSNPGQAVATPDVFRGVSLFSGARDPMSTGAWRRDVSGHLAGSFNDLEAPAIAIAPIIGSVLDALHSLPGCRLARMSGSGATCFGLFDDVAAQDLALNRLRASHGDWWIVGTTLR